MNRREFLGAVGASVGVAVPYNSATDDCDTEDAEEPVITEELSYVLDDYADETGRVFKTYEMNLLGRHHRKWTMETIDGEMLQCKANPPECTKAYWHGRVLMLYFWSDDGEYKGYTYLSLDEDYTYHLHTLDGKKDMKHREPVGDEDRWEWFD